MSVETHVDRGYHIRLDRRDDGDGAYWFATVEELPGCMSDGDTRATRFRGCRMRCTAG